MAWPRVQLQFSGSVTKFYPVVLRGSHLGLVFQEVLVFKESTMLASLTLFFWLECSCLGLKWEPGHKRKGRELKKKKKKAEIKGWRRPCQLYSCLQRSCLLRVRHNHHRLGNRAVVKKASRSQVYPPAHLVGLLGRQYQTGHHQEPSPKVIARKTSLVFFFLLLFSQDRYDCPICCLSEDKITMVTRSLSSFPVRTAQQIAGRF